MDISCFSLANMNFGYRAHPATSSTKDHYGYAFPSSRNNKWNAKVSFFHTRYSVIYWISTKHLASTICAAGHELRLNMLLLYAFSSSCRYRTNTGEQRSIFHMGYLSRGVLFPETASKFNIWKYLYANILQKKVLRDSFYINFWK